MSDPTTFTKLRSGAWGVRGVNLTDGESVTVSKKDGSATTVLVDRVIWRGDDGICLAAIVASGQRDHGRSGGQRPLSNGASAKTGKCEQCGKSCKPQFRVCWDCKCVNDEGEADFNYGANRKPAAARMSPDEYEGHCEAMEAASYEDRMHLNGR